MTEFAFLYLNPINLIKIQCLFNYHFYTILALSLLKIGGHWGEIIHSIVILYTWSSQLIQISV